MAKYSELKGDIILTKDQEYESLKFYSQALEYTSKQSKIFDLKEKLNRTNGLLQTNFLEKPYETRKLILIDNEQADLSSNNFQVLLKKDLPELKFPVGHPINKELYIGHPYNPNVYMPLSNFEENLFMDRFQEFSYFLQSLGATSISIVNSRGSELSESGEISGNTSFSVDTLIAESKTTKEQSIKSGKQKQKSKHISRKQIFSPVRKPFLSDNLIWYPNETSWQRLYYMSRE